MLEHTICTTQLSINYHKTFNTHQCEFDDDFANMMKHGKFFYKTHKHNFFPPYVFDDARSKSTYEQSLYHKIHIEIVWIQSAMKQYDT